MSDPPAQQRLAILAAAVTGVQVGAAMVGTKFLSQDIGPTSLALLLAGSLVPSLDPPSGEGVFVVMLVLDRR